MTDHCCKGLPLLVSRTRNGQPILKALTCVQVLWRRIRTAVAFSLNPEIVSSPFDNRLGRDVDRRFKHRSLNETTLTGAVAMLQTDERTKCSVQSAVGVTRSTLNSRLVFGVTSHPCQAGDLFHGLSKAGAVAPWAVKAERRHTHHHCSRVHTLDDIPVEIECFNNARSEVLDDDVGLCDEFKSKRSTFRTIKVKGDVVLVGIGRQEECAVLPPLRTAVEHAARCSHAINTPG
ncbi:unannotated protein [freshwater metagenome]